MSLPNEHSEVFAGVSGTTYELPISEQYKTNEITILGSGVIVVTAQARNSDKLSYVENGTINLDTCDTLVIEGYQLKTLGFTTQATGIIAAFVTQTDSARSAKL